MVYEMVRYFGMALDPIHIGTGGYRIGRVDNTIVRDPVTGIPKIPGTSIEGIARTYAAYQLNKVNCAGKDNEEGTRHCGQDDCPICVTFGYSKKEKSMHGMAQFSDARIMFFPVHTMIGPVWVTSPSVLQEIGVNQVKEPSEDGKVLVSDILNKKVRVKINLGWILFEVERTHKLKKETPITAKKPNDTKKSLDELKIPGEIVDKVVLTTDTIFEHVVKSNLEVRTSVSINPETGAAEEHALFTYEAIPRSAIFWFDVVYNDPTKFKVQLDQNTIKSTVDKGFDLFEVLGIGGMGTRGFGRLRVLNRGD